MAANQTASTAYSSPDTTSLYEMILESVAEGIIVVDASGTITFANNSTEKALGYKDCELNLKHYRAILFGDRNGSSDANFGAIDFTLSEGEKSHVQNDVFVRSDGSELWVEYACNPLTEGDEVTGAVITFQDISERRDREVAVTDAREAALEAARVKASFLASMSHEIRTPLNGIIGVTSLLASSWLTQEQKEYAAILQSSGNELLEIVNDILDLSKIEARRFELNRVNFDLRPYIAEVCATFKAEAARKNLGFEVNISDAVPDSLFGDKGKLRKVLNNLLGNALKFTENGAVSLDITTDDSDANEAVVRFTVTDSGIGIPADRVASIFEPFTQGALSTAERYGGTGLGLTIAKDLAAMLGGEIGLESEVGKGSTFWFTAKLALADTGPIPEPEIHLSDAANVGSEVPILVVEDNEINRIITVKLLQRLGYEADATTNGLGALKAMASKNYKLILMDRQMPVMDGVEATRLIRMRDDGSEQTKIVAMTAGLFPAEREDCLNAGMDDILAKPITKETLSKMLKKYIGPARTAENDSVDGLSGVHPLDGIIEPAKLESFVEIESRGESDFIKELLTVYMGHTETGLVDLEKAVVKGGLALIKKTAHSLKGSSGNIGITSLYDEFQALELVADSGNWEEIKKSIEKILQVFENTKETISKAAGFGG